MNTILFAHNERPDVEGRKKKKEKNKTKKKQGERLYNMVIWGRKEDRQTQVVLRGAYERKEKEGEGHDENDGQQTRAFCSFVFRNKRGWLHSFVGAVVAADRLSQAQPSL